jgi:adenylate cyclase
MNHLQQMRGRPVPRRLGLPAWIERLAMSGITSGDQQVVRRQRLVNIFAYASAFNAFSQMAVLATQQFDRLLVSHSLFTALALAMLAVPRLHRVAPNLGAHVLTFLSLGAIALATWFYGRDAQIYVYFTLSGVLLLIFGIDNWRHYVAWLMVAATAMLACLELMPQSGVMPVTAGERNMLTVQAYSNTFAVMALVTFFAMSNLRRQEVELEIQYERSAALMNTVFPTSIVQRLTSGEEDRIADRIEGLSVLFADLVGFTTASHDLPPEQIIDWLDAMVRRFDALAAEHGVDKIKTIGDCYMAVGGIVGEPKQQAEALARLAQAMMEAQAETPALGSTKLALRIGLHFGSATAGVIGSTRFSYDVWGDAVNMASRLESHGIPGTIQVSDAFRAAAGANFAYTERGMVDIRGIGPVRTWLMNG